MAPQSNQENLVSHAPKIISNVFFFTILQISSPSLFKCFAKCRTWLKSIMQISIVHIYISHSSYLFSPSIFMNYITFFSPSEMLQSIGVFLTKSIGFHLRCSWANLSLYAVFLRLYPETFCPRYYVFSQDIIFCSYMPFTSSPMVKYIHSSPEKPSTKYNLTHN